MPDDATLHGAYRQALATLAFVARGEIDDARELLSGDDVDAPMVAIVLAQKRTMRELILARPSRSTRRRKVTRVIHQPIGEGPRPRGSPCP